ncbi:MAG: NADP-dependent isocitrate dehydrogenase [Chloroflexi bacterium]|nr:NADP-dependent isocitrate dehydrogenase [Anaerolineaceae bacterium]NMB90118.1 NADP-dependent isocitrate dehydrogenase [Chloroflexota bacterium]
MTYKYIQVPEAGEKIAFENGKLAVPDCPIIPFIEGDGIGPDVWRAARRVIDAAVHKAYAGKRSIAWTEVYAGQKSFDRFANWLPEETLEALKEFTVGIKGPLATPVGGGIRSLNVALRTTLDLFACVRPVRWFKGLPSPVCKPEDVNMVVFRENTEDLYAGIEFESGAPDNRRFLDLLRQEFPAQYAKIRFPDTTGIGIKPVSRQGSQRLVRAAIQWSLDNHRSSVTLVHKGNIMKFTEGAFRSWGYDLAEQEFGERVYTRRQWEATRKEHGEVAANQEEQDAAQAGRLLVKDIIADIAFEATITRAAEFDVLATMNLNGDYLSDALAAQVGGVGIAPGGNINYDTGAAVFEATHGTAPPFANLDKANPSSLILSGELLLRHLGWNEAAGLIVHGLEDTIAARTVTFDLHRLMENATLLGTTAFGDAVIRHMD